MDNQGVGSHSEPFFELLQPNTPPISTGSTSYVQNGPASRPPNSNFSFTHDDVLPNYDFQPIRSNGGSSSGARIVEDSGSKYRPYEVRDPPVTYEKYESSRPRQHEFDKDAYDSATAATVERTMKKYADNLLRVLEGIGGRLSQLEATTQRLEQSFEKVKVSSANNHGETEGRLRMLENMLREVQRGVQVLRDKQEINEAQLQLKLQQEKNEPAATKTEIQAPPPPPPPPAPAPVVIPQQVQQQPPQVEPPQHHHQLPVAPPLPQQLHAPPPPPPPPQPAVVHPSPPPPPPPPPTYPYPPPPQQQLSYSHQPEAPPYPPQPAPPPPPPPPPSQPHQPPPHQLHQSQPPSYSTFDYMQPGYGPPPRPHQQQQQHGPPPQMYESLPGRTGSGPLALPPPPSYAPQQQQQPPPPSYEYGGSGGGYSRIPSGGGGGGGGGGYPHLPTAQPVQQQARPGSRSGVEDVIDKVAAMGFPREQVRGTVQRLTEKGQSVDMNVVLDKLMNSGGPPEAGPPKPWFGR